MRKSLNIHPFEKKRKVTKIGFISLLENQIQISESKNHLAISQHVKPVKYIKNGKVKLLKSNNHDTVF